MPTHIRLHPSLRLIACTAFLLLATLAGAQDHVDAPLPEAPAPSPAAAAGGQASVAMAGPYVRYIEPGFTAPRMTRRNKVALGFRNAFTPGSIASWPLVAGYEQVRNSSPNFEQIPRGYLRRVGAAGARDSAEEIFANSLFAPILHQDPRYYRVGRRRGIAYRLIYSVTRPLITRTDAGRSAPNVSYVLGVACSAWLTDAYYPTLNQGPEQNAKTFAGSMGASALGYAVVEFGRDALESMHLAHRQ